MTDNEIPSKTMVDGFEEPQVLNKREALDIHALEYMLPREMEIHRFTSKREANNFMTACVDSTPEKLGIKYTPKNIPQVALLEFLKENGVLITFRQFPKLSDYWRNGWYIYRKRLKDNDVSLKSPERNWELAYFVSAVLAYVGKQEVGGKIVMAREQEFHVRTNVRL